MIEEKQNRWESYVMYHQKAELEDFWREFYQRRPDAKVLFLLGKGFDPRMNNILKLLLQTIEGLHLECITFDFPDVGHSIENQKLYDANTQELEELKQQYGFRHSEIQIGPNQSWDKRIALMSRQMIDKDLSGFDDVIMDVSSLPRAFYFNIAKALYNKLNGDLSKNLFYIALSSFIGIFFALTIVKRIVRVPTAKKLEIQYIHRTETKEFLTEYFQEKNIVIEDVNFDVKFMEDYRIYTNIYTIDLPRGLGFSEVIEELSVYKNVTKIRLVDIA